MQDGSLIGSAKPRRAFGRSLTDFRIEGATTSHGLHPAEEKLLRCVAGGEVCEIALERPEQATMENLVRAAFLRFLLVGGDDENPVHEKGVQLDGAFIQGRVDLESAKGVCAFWFYRCRLEHEFYGRNATYDEINFQHCHLLGINCESASIKGNVSLSECLVEGEVCFLGADIGVQLDCSSAKFKNPNAIALNCEGAKVTGSVFLSHGFTAEGEVRFLNAKIGGNFACMGGHFKNRNAARSINTWEASFAETALNLQNAQIGGLLCLGPARLIGHQQVTIEGSLDLQGAHAKEFVDDSNSWPLKHVLRKESDPLPYHIHLDGFTYKRFAGEAPSKASIRKHWLLRQRPAHLNESFRPQPFHQLVKVLRDMGHEADARRIAMFKEELLHPIRIRDARPIYRPFVWLISRLFGLICGYGYRPHRLFAGLAMLWLVCGLAYQTGAAHGGFAPRDAQVWTSEAYQKACKDSWTRCQDIKKVIAFSPFLYSADVLLPGIDLGQRSAWMPMSRGFKLAVWENRSIPIPNWTLRTITWAETSLGLGGVILIGAILSGIIKRD